MTLAHIDYQGIGKTKSLLRSKVWSPVIKKMIEEGVKMCIPSQTATA